MSRVNPGRLAALRVLIDVDGGAHAEDQLARLAPPSGPDRGLSWHLVLGTLRWQGSIDHALRGFLNKPIPRLDTGVLCALRMGVFEMHHSKTPARAVVHQTVEAVKLIGLARASGMVNAVLRKCVSQPLSTEPEHQLPAWLYGRWAEHERWLTAIQTPAPLCLAGVAPEGLDLKPASLQGATLRDLWVVPPGFGSVSHLPGFKAGHFWVMDPSAAKVADLVTENLPAGGTVLDACAAPGGKTFRMLSRGAAVTSVDCSPKRLERFEENCNRLQIKPSVWCHDWTTGPCEALGAFDAVLVDAPCTGLGTVRRHPEILWRRAPGDPASMGVSQRQILQNASVHVKPGGCLIYAVCSTEPEEGTDVIASLEGWNILQEWNSVPPSGDEDGFQAFLLKADTA